MKTAVPCYYHIDVEVSSERVGQVSRILAAHLRYWDLDNLAVPVCRGAELLLRAIDQHVTDKRTSIEMWWNGQHLITAFGDDDPDLRPDQDLRAALADIAAMSDGWGCCTSDSGSKIIWFSQRARAGQRVPLVPTAPAPTLRNGLTVPREMPMAVLAAPAAAVDDALAASAAFAGSVVAARAAVPVGAPAAWGAVPGGALKGSR
ncbi:pep a2 [Streptomyces yokosukanensis]|uniref:pep a2 n=1 Tax=Streptomyces yokosukanensis TaxID=67386 RepID=UPI000ACB6C6F|nr:pep a2 [Streptomyces yokosukanensis]